MSWLPLCDIDDLVVELADTRATINGLLDARSVGPDAHARALDRLARLREREAGLLARIAELEAEAA